MSPASKGGGYLLMPGMLVMFFNFMGFIQIPYSAWMERSTK